MKPGQMAAYLRYQLQRPANYQYRSQQHMHSHDEVSLPVTFHVAVWQYLVPFFKFSGKRGFPVK
jgi:hypothetical protein